MEWTILGFAGVALITLLFWKRATAAAPKILREHLAAGALVIDVRSPEEFRGGHVPGAVNIPLPELLARLPRQVPDQNQVLMLHCQSGLRSRNGLRQLQRLGYKRVFNLGSLARAQELVASARSGPSAPAI